MLSLNVAFPAIFGHFLSTGRCIIFLDCVSYFISFTYPTMKTTMKAFGAGKGNRRRQLRQAQLCTKLKGNSDVERPETPSAST